MPTPKLMNFVLFQIGWFACVLGAAGGAPWLGTGVALAIVAGHVFRAGQPHKELVLLAIAAFVGLLFDSAMIGLGWTRFPNGVLIAGTAPHWMVALWVLFASTLNVSLGWLKRFPRLSVLFGAVGGPLAYASGAKLGALSLPAPTSAFIALAIGWGLITPLLVTVAKRFDGFLRPVDPPTLSEVSRA